MSDQGYNGGVVVNGKGPPNAPFLVGEAPGESEARRGEGFVGRAGQELDNILRRTNTGLHVRSFYRVNIVREYTDGNPDPTPAQISHWTPHLERDIAHRRPRFIVAAGKFAVRWFLGDELTLDMVHGLPHLSDRAPDSIIIPAYHPAAGFYDDDQRMHVYHDYARVAAILTNRASATPTTDAYPSPIYTDVSGKQLAAILRGIRHPLSMALDTEGIPREPWSIQVTVEEGVGYVLRVMRSDFAIGVAAIRAYLLRKGTTAIVHNAMYDIEMCDVMGLDLADPRIHLIDTRYMSYALRTEPQGLKPLSYRWTGARQRSYEDTVGPIGLEKQLEYLIKVTDTNWDDPEARIEYGNDGTARLYKPQSVTRRAESIVTDYYSGKLDKDGYRTDPLKRWRKVDTDQRRAVERAMGPMPIGTLADIPLEEAVYYAGRDPDVTLRTHNALVPVIKKQGLEALVAQGCYTLPIFEEMQRTGMLADREYCDTKYDERWTDMRKLQSRISHKYYGGQPFNPASPDKVAALMRRRGLVGEKRSKITHKMSTGKKSIEHLRHTDDAMADVIDWREHQKMRDSFYGPISERIIDASPDTNAPLRRHRIRTHINPYKVVSRRISSSDPNLTAIPVRNELGLEVRNAFYAEDGYELGSWDLSQIEMRYMAHESRDPLLTEFFSDPTKDVHSETAARIFHLPIVDSPDPSVRYAAIDEMAHRYPSKRAGFGIITNISGAGLLDQLRMFGCKGWDVPKCDRLVADWLGVYKGVKRYMDDAIREARQFGFVRDRWGMYRYLPGIYSSDRKTVAEAERAASSMKIQGGAQGMLQNAMAWLRAQIYELRKAGFNIRWILQVHDEVLLEYPADMREVVDALIMEALTNHHGVPNITVPIKANGVFGASWGEL